jgi:hypothetical protein
VFLRKDRVAYEGVRIARWIAAGLPDFISGPEELPTAFTLIPVESLVPEVVKVVLLLREHGNQPGVQIAGQR